MNSHEITNGGEGHVPATCDRSRQNFAGDSELKKLTHLVTFSEMGIDQAKQPGSTAQSVSRGTSRVPKRRSGKGRATMVFPTHMKGKRVGTRLRAQERKKGL